MSAPPTESLADLIIALHNARGGYLRFAERLARLREAFDADHRQLIELTAQSRRLVAELERRLSFAAVERYERTGETRIAPGVAIYFGPGSLVQPRARIGDLTEAVALTDHPDAAHQIAFRNVEEQRG